VSKNQRPKEWIRGVNGPSGVLDTYIPTPTSAAIGVETKQGRQLHVAASSADTCFTTTAIVSFGPLGVGSPRLFRFGEYVQ